MHTLTLFWKPILLSAVLCHIASALVWMVLPIHKNDYKSTGEKEQSILDFLRSLSLAPGMYNLPYCQHADMKKPEVVAKMKAGPHALITVMPGLPSMGKSMGMWILNLLLIAFGVAYIVGSAGMKPGAHEYLHLFKVCGLIAFMAFAGNALTMSIWMGQPWAQLPGRIIDAVIYAALMAGCFAGLWPHAA